MQHLNSTRIVGGKEAIPHSLPWQVAIINVKIGMSVCGGTILAPKFIMTAGHCTHRKEPSTYQVWAGAHDLTTFDGKGVGQSGHTIAKFHNNPNYRYHTDKGTYLWANRAYARFIMFYSCYPQIMRTMTFPYWNWSSQ